MSLSPAEIRHAELGRGLFGYKRTAVDRLLDEIVDSFEQVWRERADLTDKVEELETDIVRYRELETLLRTTLVSAERASKCGRSDWWGRPGPDRRVNSTESGWRPATDYLN